MKQLNNISELKQLRRELRKNLTPAEATLWMALQKSQLDGVKFRRQHSVARYILDFYCPKFKLAIELDGEMHNDIVSMDYDEERTTYLNNLGIKVIRFENKEVFIDLDRVLEEIKSHLTTPYPSLPRRGVESHTDLAFSKI